MRLKTPHFWYRTDSAAAKLLGVLSPLYNAGHKLNQKLGTTYKSKIPVICIGNLVSGGSGKTPTALAILDIINTGHLAKSPCFLTRGYGGKNKGPLRADKDKHTAADIGDEALLLAGIAPTIISAHRGKGAELAENKKHDLIIMDDGLQNPQLYQDIKIVVIDGNAGFGNGRTLPAGPLRESLKSGLQKADAFVLIGEDKQNVTTLFPTEKPVFNARVTVPQSWVSNTDIPYIAFSGLAHPDKFKNTLEETGINIMSWHPYPDHYAFSDADLKMLATGAKEKSARLITTEKDAARLPRSFIKDNQLDILPIQIEWEDRESLMFFLKQRL